MASITLHGSKVNTLGMLPELNTQAPDFTLVNTDLVTKSLKDFAGKNLILNIFPSVDTGVCAASVRAFNQKAAALENTEVLCISKDLPFAQKRFCGAEGIENVTNLSDFREGQFGKDYNVTIADGPMQGLHSRAIVIINSNGKVIYTEQVSEIADEPNYDAAIAAL
ncbi:thiol peroxidase [Flavobacterium ardleyense]|uniref:thiol peroxidase n=1 Tax=Flavobacterium ardleyense TaxID=2038737 RepID=UPI00298C1B8A|nr:thiol peroxidase [Flavobacterium ardleyense]